MKSKFSEAVLLQFSGTVGSGIFVLPYLLSQSNFLFASVIFLFLTVVTVLINRFYADIILATPGDHQLVGYSRIYLGSRTRLLAVLNLFLLAFGAMVAYQKLFVSFASLLFPAFPPYFIFLSYFFLLFLFFQKKFKFGSGLNLFLGFFTLILPFILFFYVLLVNHTSYFINLSPGFGFFGAAVFALSGFTIIPEVDELLRLNQSHKSSLYRASLLGTVLAAVCIYLFAFAVVTLSGRYLSPDSVTGLFAVHPVLSLPVVIFGLVILFRSSLNFLVILRELFHRDLYFPAAVSSFLPFIFPLLSYFILHISYLTVISITGDITIFISALLICLIRLRLSDDFPAVFTAFAIIITLGLGLLSALF